MIDDHDPDFELELPIATTFTSSFFLRLRNLGLKMSSWSWSPKTHTSRFTQKINSALQIQYLVGTDYDQNKIWCSSLNIFLLQQGRQRPDSKYLEEVNIWWFPVELFHPLRLITWKYWILADLWDKRKNELESGVKSLLAAYILYYEEIMDHILPLEEDCGSDEERLKVWFEIDVTTGNHTLVPPESYRRSRGQGGRDEYQVWAESSADKAALSWGFYQFFNLGRWDKVDKQGKEDTFSKVLLWLREHSMERD